jgi:putative addiction module antidote
VPVLRITTVGNSAGVVLPRELLVRLRVEKGDRLYVSESPDGILLTPYDPEVAAQLDRADVIMKEHKEVLRRLAT